MPSVDTTTSGRLANVPVVQTPQGGDGPLGRRSALLVATAAYADPQFARLRQPVSGVAALASALGSAQAGGFDTDVLADGSQAEIQLAVARFLAGRGADETVLLYLSCHAVKDRAQTYFASANTVFRYPQRSAVPVQAVTAELARCGAGHRILVLDCCFSGGLADDRGDFDLAAELALAGSGIAVLSATRSREYSYEGRPLGVPPARSMFTEGLAEGLTTGAADADRDGLITLAEAYNFAYRYVRRHQPAQAPQYALDDRLGEIVLALAQPAGAATSEAPPITAPPITAPPITAAAITTGPAITGPATVSAYLVPPVSSAAVSSTPVGSPPASEGRERGRHDARAASPAGPDQEASRGSAATLLEHDRYDAYCVAFSPDSLLIASGGWGRPVRIRRTADGALVRELKSAGTSVYDLTFSPDGTLLATGSRDGTVAVSEVASGRRARARKPSGVPVRALAFAAHGGLLASAHEDGALRVWDPATLGRPREFRTGGQAIYGTAVSPDAKLAAAACADGTIRVWHVPDGVLVASIKCHTGWATAVAFTPDGTLLASAGADGTIVLHDALSGAQVGGRPAGQGIVNAIALSADGTLLAAGYETGAVSVWELATGNHTPLRGHSGFVNDVTFSPDGRLLASAGKDGSVRLWR
jgi:hypothetical protein